MEKMNIVIVGHVDHGKSTLVGRLLADTNSLPEGKLQKVKENCARKSKKFEYAFLIDALKDEWSQGITIDIARIFFKSSKRKYIILDAPGHIEFLKNMVTGASHAEAAILVIDANEGVQENSKRHGYMLSMLGVKQITVAVNKMDLVNYDKKSFEKIKTEYTDFLNEIGVVKPDFIPVSGFMGDNITKSSKKLSWYDGDTLLEHLDHFKKEAPAVEQSFRMFLQDVYKFTTLGDARRLFVGTIETGKISEGDEITFYPYAKKSKIKAFEFFSATHRFTMTAGNHVAFTLEEEVHVPRGALVCSNKDTSFPIVSHRFQASIFWLGKQPLQNSKAYVIKIGNQKSKLQLLNIDKVINASNLDLKQNVVQVERHEVAVCNFFSNSMMAFDLEIPKTNRFVIIDDYEISGGGIILANIENKYHDRSEPCYLSTKFFDLEAFDYNYSRELRLRRYKSFLLLLVSETDEGKRCVQNFGNMLVNEYGLEYNLYHYGLLKKEKSKIQLLNDYEMLTSALLDVGKNILLSFIGFSKKEIEEFQKKFSCVVYVQYFESSIDYSVEKARKNLLLKTMTELHDKVVLL